jgi:hypothetical protein
VTDASQLRNARLARKAGVAVHNTIAIEDRATPRTDFERARRAGANRKQSPRLSLRGRITDLRFGSERPKRHVAFHQHVQVTYQASVISCSQVARRRRLRSRATLRRCWQPGLALARSRGASPLRRVPLF